MATKSHSTKDNMRDFTWCVVFVMSSRTLVCTGYD